MIDENIDPARVARCMLVVETDDGVQRGWHVDNITEIGWDYLGTAGGSAQGRFRVSGQFWRKRKSPQSRQLEQRWRDSVGQVERVIDAKERETDLEAGWTKEIEGG